MNDEYIMENIVTPDSLQFRLLFKFSKSDVVPTADGLESYNVEMKF